MLLPLSLLLLVVEHVHAVRIPFVVNTNDLSRREPVAVGNTGNAQYVANITIAGNSIPVLLDTGSSDLWVYFSKPPADKASIVDSGVEVSLSYAVGTAHGHAQRTTVSFGGYTVKDQAFLLVEDTSTFTGDIKAQGYQGLLGMGPNSGSVVRKKLDKENADTLLQNVFNRAGLKDNYITLLLDRKNDLSDPFKGEMTISELVPGFENITSMPRLDVETVTRLLKSDQHWQALTDKDNGIIGPDGKAIYFDSIVPRAPDGQLVAVIDSGFTFSQVPREVADAIYGRVKGAVYDSANEWWLLPCGQYLPISFNFGGRNYPIHPLDVVDDNFSKIDGSGKKVCIGSFQPITSAFSLLGHYDMILGMNFLRSVYTLYNFGSWIDNGNEDEHPYMQMTALTDVNAARKEFVELRLAGQDVIDSDPRWALLPADQMVASPVGDEEKKKKYQEMVLSRWPYIFLGCLAFLGLSIGFCVWKCCQRRKANGGKWTKKGALSRGLIPDRFGGKRGQDDEQGNGGFSNVAERDRDTELYSSPNHPPSIAGRPSIAKDPYGSSYDLDRTQSTHSLPAYQQSPPQQYQAYDNYSYANSSTQLTQPPAQPDYNSPSYGNSSPGYAAGYGR